MNMEFIVLVHFMIKLIIQADELNYIGKLILIPNTYIVLSTKNSNLKFKTNYYFSPSV